MTKFKCAALFISIALVIGTVPVNAETMSISVSYADLNLASHAGVAQLDRRIANAVTMICGIEISVADNWPRIRKCRRDALAGTKMRRSQALVAAETRRNAELASR